MDTADPLAESELPDDEVVVCEELAQPPRKGMTRRLVGGTLNYGVGQALPQMLRFLQLLVFSHVLTETDYGVLELAGTFSIFLMQFMRLGVPGAVTRFYFDHREGPSLTDYVTTIFIFLLGSSAVIGLGTWLAGPWLFEHLIPDLKFYPYGLLALGTAVITCNQNLQDKLVQAREQSSYMAVLNVVRAVIFIALALTFVLALRWGATGMLLAELIAAALIFVQAGWYLRPNLRGHFQPEMLRTSVIYGLGVLPSHLVWNLAALVTNSILADAIDLGAVGELGFARRFVLPLTVLASACQTAFIPIYFSLRSDYSAKNIDALVRTARFVWAGAITVAIGGVFFIPPMLRLMTPQEYHNAATLVPILVVGFLSQTVYFVFGPELYYSKKTYLVPIVTASSAIVSVLFTLATVKSMGAAGVAWANSLGSVALTVTAVILSRRLVSIPHRAKDLLRLAICGLAVFAVAWPLADGTVARQIAVALVAAPAYPLLLWICGDPTVREAAEYAAKHWSAFTAR
ncbi:MAG TPA: oligosaccharide flippase family protein [Pirellulales bacterium]|jgi:O-antigen/teichoic acid export membrane protein|nr:oligosaccharide flippase family protein [Pirellulales bacterium]